MRKHQYILIFLATFALFFQLGCPNHKCKVLPPLDADTPLPGVSKTLSVDIFLDATLSMKGFIVPNVTSRYEQSLQLLERTVGTAWEGGQAKFYRFGSTITEIRNRGYLAGVEPGFYSDPTLFQRTLIENVIGSADIEHLTVIVTDLFQDSADVSLLTGEIKKKYLVNNLAVGILGIKSEFQGNVYDVGVRNYTFPYSSGTTQAERFRPFYLIMLGKHRDIERYYEKLESSGLSSFPISKFIIFSNYLEDPLPTFSNGKVDSTEKAVEVGGLLISELKDTKAKQFRLRGNPETATVVAVLKRSPLRYTMPFSVDVLEPEIKAWKYQSDNFTESEAAKRAFNIVSTSVGQQDITIQAQVASGSLPGEGIYCFQVILRPKGYLMPDWVAAWDMPLDRVEAWRSSPKDFNGATTYNLKHFLNDLWETLVQLHKPRDAEFTCYIQK